MVNNREKEFAGNNPMKIGVVSHMFPSIQQPVFGSFVRNELDCLSKHVDIRLIAPVPLRHWFKNMELPQGIEYPVKRPRTVSFPRFFMQRLYPRSMAVTLRKSAGNFFEDCDIIHAHNAFPDAVAAEKAFGGKFPIVVTVHGSDINMFAEKPNLRPDIVRALNKAECVICVSESLRKKLLEMGVRTNCEVIPNGVDTDLFAPGNRTEACGLLEFEPERPRILFVGNFVKVKGIEYLIRAMPTVLIKYPDCELVLLGAEPGSNTVKEYRTLIESAGISDSVRIEPRIPHGELSKRMHASDILVLPSLSEGFGLVAAEALACGIPVVATRCGGPESIVSDGLGFLVPPCDHEALGDGILRALDGSGLLNSAAMADSIHERFSLNTVTGRILEVYNRIGK
ncbi:glycosyltransferase family 4 protein [Candidatus Latescibacterota bacterium]